MVTNMQSGQTNRCITPGFGLALLLVVMGVIAQAKERPNIVFVVSDDLNTHVGPYLDPSLELHTPNLDGCPVHWRVSALIRLRSIFGCVGAPQYSRVEHLRVMMGRGGNYLYLLGRNEPTHHAWWARAVSIPRTSSLQQRRTSTLYYTQLP